VKWGLGIFPFQMFYFYILGNVLGRWLKGFLKFQRGFSWWGGEGFSMGWRAKLDILYITSIHLLTNRKIKFCISKYFYEKIKWEYIQILIYI
jgi:hypothetical protein